MSFSRLVLDGRIDVVRASQVRQEAISCAAESQNNLVLDLQGVTFIDSSGLGAIVGTFQAIRQAGGSLYLYGIQPSVQMVIELVGLDQVLPILKTEDELNAVMS